MYLMPSIFLSQAILQRCSEPDRNAAKRGFGLNPPNVRLLCKPRGLAQTLSFALLKYFSLHLLPWLTHPVEQFWHWVIIPSSFLSNRPAANSSRVSFWFCFTGAWQCFCFWVSVFVQDRELEIRGKHLCTCIPFKSHLVSSLPLSLSTGAFPSRRLSDTLVCWIRSHSIKAAPGRVFLCGCM